MKPVVLQTVAAAIRYLRHWPQAPYATLYSAKTDMERPDELSARCGLSTFEITVALMDTASLAALAAILLVPCRPANRIYLRPAAGLHRVESGGTSSRNDQQTKLAFRAQYRHRTDEAISLLEETRLAATL